MIALLCQDSRPQVIAYRNPLDAWLWDWASAHPALVVTIVVAVVAIAFFVEMFKKESR